MLAELCLAATVYLEARGESKISQIAVAQVVVNRTYARSKDVCSVVREPGQFAWVHPNNIPKNDSWKESLDVAKEVLEKQHKDPTNGAQYFHSGSKPKNWKSLVNVATIGNHKFYRKTEPKPETQVAQN
jgi:N-acetylmuramoyl-L-alanine amidase